MCAAAADVGLHVDATAYMFSSYFVSDVIMNEHLNVNNGQQGYGVGRSVLWGKD